MFDGLTEVDMLIVDIKEDLALRYKDNQGRILNSGSGFRNYLCITHWLDNQIGDKP
jgi:hypothetical protein